MPTDTICSLLDEKFCSANFWPSRIADSDGQFDYHPRTESLFYVMNLVSPGAQPAPGTTFPQTKSSWRTSPPRWCAISSNNFTRSDGPDTNQPAYPAAIVPASLPGSTLGFHRSLDAEGIRLTSDGTFYTNDEYSPFIYHFIRFGCLLDTTYGSHIVSFTAATGPDSGRRSNRGLDGLGITDHGIIPIRSSSIICSTSQPRINMS